MKTNQDLMEQNAYELVEIINSFKEKAEVLQELSELLNLLFWSLDNDKDIDANRLRRLIVLLNGLKANQDNEFVEKKFKFLKDYFNVEREVFVAEWLFS